MAKKKVPSKGTRAARTDRRGIFSALKRILRARRITYAELASRLGLSESGVKKLFAQEDCTLSRLEAIASAAGVPMGELFEAASSAPFEHVALTRAQQEALLAQPRLLNVFWKLSVERWSPKRIARAFELDDRALFRALAELDRLDLIILEQPGDRVRLRHGDLVRWLPDGPLLEHLHDAWGRELLARAARAGHLRLNQMWLRPEARVQLEADLATLLDSYVRRGRAEWLAAGEGAVSPHGLVVAFAEGSFVRPGTTVRR
ncbi:MAG: transcriptional regulator [Labilithrix sp.]|jgi:transcriptional regulator with XRE-family HTH domain|nr:transcriptional regulator [Labilithrix sp.]